MADIIQNNVVLQEFLPVYNSNLTPTLDLVLRNGINDANKQIVVIKGTKELNAPSADTALEKDRIAADGSNARKTPRASVQNTCEIITKYVSLSDTETILEGGRLASEIGDAILELKQDVNMHIWKGVLSNNDPRKMAGILTATPAGQKVTKVKADMSKELVVAAVNTIKKASVVDTIFGGYDAVQYLAGLLKAAETRVQNDGSIVLDVNRITIAGQVFDIVYDESLENQVVFGASKVLELYALKPLTQTALSKTGRTTDYLIDMEYTVLNRNPKAFYSFTISDLA